MNSVDADEDDSADAPRPSRPASLSFGEWLSQPQTMIGLAAVLLSLCGLFISIYETSLVHQQQRASVWPRVQVGPQLRGDSVKILVSNDGIGPARLRAAAVEHEDDRLAGWTDMMARVGIQGDVSTRLLNRRVLSPDSEIEAFVFEDSTHALRNSILNGDLDITLCYCSVYEECWVTSMQSYVGVVVPDSLRESEPGRPHRRVDECGHIEPSRI